MESTLVFMVSLSIIVVYLWQTVLSITGQGNANTTTIRQTSHQAQEQ